MGLSVQQRLPPDQLALWPAVMTAGEAQALFEQLLLELRWTQPELTVFGKSHPIPRRQSWVGDPEAHYTYSSQAFSPGPWHPLLKDLAVQLSGFFGQPFNSVLANHYRDGQDHMGWHSDDEPELGPVIAMLSLGAERELAFRPRGGGPSFKVSLPSGSLLLMGPGLQQQWQHGLPSRAKVADGRISLTFRQVRALNIGH
ncbi:alpha-ketoglutarate-dependent dioxygenase AlkB [Gallaecimonas kandeliae]|uniref:alpha-ketoglutarate-dependent dioxygenase AlkB family protein n=1 Tax=Gallaecimonas kandeliae TaxID=3029055 RepID=UPI0026487FA0|nr:alpha-ketoglutarate-dependent dioxygenase AlkB [Gallaecimonas kandeliae]WKE64894.1 alpha-ketoglutarate-dependent dioxygenase AlkB [Gallaecimonas kandeliae]